MTTPASDVYKDMFDPSWREREIARVEQFKAAIPTRPEAAYVHTHKTGEAHLVPIQVADIK